MVDIESDANLATELPDRSGAEPVRAGAEPVRAGAEPDRAGAEPGYSRTLPSAKPLDGAASPSSSGGRPSATHTLPVVARSCYRVERELSRGGQGRILIAYDQKLLRPVALKELLRLDSGTEQRFLREVLLTARLQHPSIVVIHDVGRWETGEPFYTMSLVPGRSLLETLAVANTLEARLALIPNLVAIADAMAFAHNHHVVHRDLKPANVLVGSFGETVVIDWGLAKDLRGASDEPAVPLGVLADSGGFETAAGSVMGTPAYMPPEQALGQAVDESADVYAIGAILYHAFCGQAPYSGSASAILEKLQREPPPPIETRAPGLPADLCSIVAKAMARVPLDRYATAKELADELRRFQTGRLVASHRYSLREMLLRWVRKNRAVVGLGVASLIALSVTIATDRSRIAAERDRAQAALEEVNQRPIRTTAPRNRAAPRQARHSLEVGPNHRGPADGRVLCPISSRTNGQAEASPGRLLRGRAES